MLHSEATALHLACARIVVFGLALVTVALTPVGLFQALPEAFSAQPRILGFAIPVSAGALGTIQVAAVAGCVACLLGSRPYRPVAITTWLLLVLHQGLVKSFFAFIDHAQIGLIFAVFVLALFPAADALSWQPSRTGSKVTRADYQLPLVLVAFALALCYSMLGVYRLVHGGASLFTGDALLLHLSYTGQWQGQFSVAFGAQAVQIGWLSVMLRAGFAAVTLLEVVSPLAVVYPRLRQFWLVVMVPFHLSTAVLMNILFWENLILIAVFLSPLLATVMPRKGISGTPGDREATVRRLILAR